MKKGLKALLVLLMAVICLVGCGKKEETKNVDGSLEEIMEKLYADIPEDEQPMALHNIKLLKDEEQVDPTNMDEGFVEYFIGTSDIDYKEAIASESMTGSIAHSVVLIRTEKNADIEKIKKEIEDKVDPRKWICVGIEKDEVVIKNKGDLIMVVIVQDETNRDKIEAAFDNL